MPITNLPTAPTRSDPVNFNSRADAFLVALPAFATEANTLQNDVNAKQSAAATSAANALASENAAAANSGATIWVSGTTYAIGNVRFSPTTYLSYRRKTAGAGTTDPSADNTNWQLINGTGNVDLNSTQTLTNKTFSTGSVWNGSAVPIANGGTGATTAATARSNLGTNNAANIDTGVIGTAILGSGTANSTTYLRGDNTWQNLVTAVAAANASLAVGSVGSYAACLTGTTLTAGATIAGSSLSYAGVNSNGVDSSGSPGTGTWRCMGYSFNGRLTLYLRIA